jgi:FkbM family methyltransferase
VIGKKECAFELKQTPKNIIDAGANVGYASILFANIWKNASIVAIEPEEENFKMLLKNTAPYPNIKCLRAAIWSKKCRLEVENVNAAAFSFQFHESQNDGNAKIDSVTINEIKSYFPNNNVDLLKIDIEGGELEIFKNSEQGWEEGISFIAVELHERYAKGVTDIVLDKMKNRECKVFGEYYTFFYK